MTLQEQRESLIKRLEEDGWQVNIEDDYGLDWWAAEIWRVESVWSPSGFSLWLTLLVDTQSSGKDVKIDNVWAIGVSPSFPSEKAEAEGKPFLTFGQGWGTRLSQFMSDLARIRHEAFVKAMKQSA